MNELISDNELIPVILVGLRTTEREDEFDHAMNELVALCEACDLEVLASMTQKLEHPDNATWIGSGKAEELAEEVRVNDAEHVVCLGNLSPAQMKNLQKIIKVPVWDRTNLILEIFSRRARTREARLQVESAYLQYMLPRLTGMWQHLGRQSGGGGNGCVDGVAALFENFKACLSGKGVGGGNHAARAVDDVALRREWIIPGIEFQENHLREIIFLVMKHCRFYQILHHAATKKLKA